MPVRDGKKSSATAQEHFIAPGIKLHSGTGGYFGVLMIDVPFEPLSVPDSPRILVVEDEFLIRAMISEAFRDAGFAVIEAVDADEAMRVLQSAVAIDLVFSDVRMPGSLDGLALLENCTELFPDLPVIMTSGHLSPADALARSARQFLTKPYLFDDVVAAVRLELGKRV